MNQLLQTTRLQWTLFFGAMIVVSLVLSKFMLSVGMIGLLLVAILERPLDTATDRFSIQIRKDLGQQWQSFWKHPHFWVLTLFFILPLLGGLYSEDWVYSTRKLRLKLPFLLLPFVFFLLPKRLPNNPILLY